AALLAGEVAVPVGADRDEERGRQRQLTGHPDQQRQADGGDRGAHREQSGLQPEALRVLREPQQQRGQSDPGDGLLRHASPRGGRRGGGGGGAAGGRGG